MIQTVLNEDHEIIVEVLKTIRQSMRKADKLAECSHFPLNGEMYLTDRDVAARLHISKRTLQEYRHAAILPYFIIRGKVLYRDPTFRLCWKVITVTTKMNYNREKRTASFLGRQSAFLYYTIVSIQSATIQIFCLKTDEYWRMLLLYFVCQPFSEHIGIMGSVFERNGYHYIKTVNIGMVAV